MVLWGLIQPIFSFYCLKIFTRIDALTRAAVSACFGSVSVMTFIAAISFLEERSVPYEALMIAVLAIMEIPAIIMGIGLSKTSNEARFTNSTKLFELLCESLFNKVVFLIALGLTISGFLFTYQKQPWTAAMLLPFKPLLSLFLFDMGFQVGLQRQNLRALSWPLALFGLYMPLIGGSFGLILSYLIGTDAGTSTLIAVVAASASYIAAPAAMRSAIPDAKEAVYLPLSLGIAFPFNVMIGTPLYYHLAKRIAA